MYGWINDCIEQLVLENFGAAAWTDIKKEANVLQGNGEFVKHEYYPDATTYALVMAANKVLDLPVDAILETFGRFFVGFVSKAGYQNLMAVQGTSLFQFLSNMNNMHYHLSKNGLEKIVPPAFACERDEELPDYLILHYWSEREALSPLVVGVVKQCSEDFFGQSVTFEDYAVEKVVINGEPRNYTRFVIKETEQSLRNTSKEHRALGGPVREPLANVMDGLSVGDMLEKLTFHIAFDHDMKLCHAGLAIQEMFNAPCGAKLDELFEIRSPLLCTWTAESIRRQLHQNFLLKATATTSRVGVPATSPLEIFGSIYAFGGGYIFLGGPDVVSVKELMDMGLRLSDLPMHDARRQLVLQGEQLRAELNSAKRLEEVNIELAKTKTSSLMIDLSESARSKIKIATILSSFFALFEVYNHGMDWYTCYCVHNNSDQVKFFYAYLVATLCGAIAFTYTVSTRIFAVVSGAKELTTGQTEVEVSIFTSEVTDEDRILSDLQSRLTASIVGSHRSLASSLGGDLPSIIVGGIIVFQEESLNPRQALVLNLIGSLVVLGIRIGGVLAGANYSVMKCEIDGIMLQRSMDRTKVMAKRSGVCPVLGRLEDDTLAERDHAERDITRGMRLIAQNEKTHSEKVAGYHRVATAADLMDNLLS